MKVDLSNRVAIVTGAAIGLGRSHARALARYGAKVVVIDLSLSAAQLVVEEITAAGGTALAAAASVTDAPAIEGIIRDVLGRWGRIDILVNNAGVLRDKSFGNMSLEDFRWVIEVHLMGTVICTKAVWDSMRAQKYGRIVMTTSSSGLYGNFGQANYGAAKLAIVGLMQTLGLEGAKYNIAVNCIAPSAGTRMLEGIVPESWLHALEPDLVSPAVVALACEQAPTRTIMTAGAGTFGSAQIVMSPGPHLGAGEDTATEILLRMSELKKLDGAIVPASGFQQAEYELRSAGIDTPKGPSR